MVKLYSFLGFFMATAAYGQPVDLDPKNFSHITFDDIPKTVYQIEKSELKITANKSSSFLLLPYAKKKEIRGVDFAWKSSGDLNIKSAENEQSKRGDDSRLRIGLVVAGESPTIPFFAPAWIKAIRDALKLPSDKLVYLTVGGMNPSGTTWESPYSDSMEIRAVGGTEGSDGWTTVAYTLKTPLQIVALWIMTDSDNTESSITTWLKDLSLR